MKKILLSFTVIIWALINFSCGEKKAQQSSLISIKTDPPGAKIFFNNKELGITPFEVKVKSGTYVFEIEKTNYIPQFIKVIVAEGEQKNVDLILEELTASVMLESTPPQATVEIDGKEIGVTPIILHGQKIGTHKAILKKPGMVPVEVSWKVKDARPQTVKANLLSNLGIIKINVSPANAQISIDGKPKGRSPLSENIEQGEHLITIEAPGYEKHEQNVVVNRETETVLNIALNVLPGSIDVSSEPQGATIYLNDKVIGKAPVKIPGLQPGKYQIKAEKSGFDHTIKEVEVAPGANAEISLVLDSNLGGIDLAANPPGLTVYVDGKKIGKTEKGESDKISKIFEIRGLTFGKHVIRVSHKRAVPQDYVIEVNVEKGKIARPKTINMWVVDCIIKFKSGKKELKGRLIEETDTKILFEPEPGVKIGYNKEELISIEKLKLEED